MSRAVLAAALLALAIPAQATDRYVPALHDIHWYVANDAARARTIELCRTDTAISRFSPDCANAEAAETRSWANRRTHIQTPAEMLADPRYWAANRVARAGALSQCATPAYSMMAPTAAQCTAARSGDAMDGGFVARYSRTSQIR